MYAPPIPVHNECNVPWYGTSVCYCDGNPSEGVTSPGLWICKAFKKHSVKLIDDRRSFFLFPPLSLCYAFAMQLGRLSAILILPSDKQVHACETLAEKIHSCFSNAVAVDELVMLLTREGLWERELKNKQGREAH